MDNLAYVGGYLEPTSGCLSEHISNELLNRIHTGLSSSAVFTLVDILFSHIFSVVSISNSHYGWPEDIHV